MSVLKIHMTFHCSAECDHCHLNAGRSPGPVIDYDLAKDCILALKRINELKTVVLLGGEPGLTPPRFLDQVM